MGRKENSDLVTELADDNHINTQKVERAFRLVDRGIFVSPRHAVDAYDDSPFRTNNLQPGQIHISAPSLYCSVLEYLDLHKGQSFLNIGSGSGYLSTIVGFFLGENGLNHGIELHSNVLAHARESIDIFFNQNFIVGYDWCRPEFIHGNAYLLKDITKRYDRIYVGAQVEERNLAHFSQMLKEGGIMVIPTKFATETRFQQVKRTSGGFSSVDFMHVSFADLIRPNERFRQDIAGDGSGRKRKLVEDENNPNERITDNLLSLFKPRSLEMLASYVVRKQVGDEIRMTHPIAIMQDETLIRDVPNDFMTYAVRHFLRPGFLPGRMPRHRCTCPYAVCGCHHVPSLKRIANRVIIAHMNASESRQLIKKTPWMKRLNRLNNVFIKAYSFTEEMPPVLKEDPSPPLPNGRYSIEDWSKQQKREKFNEQIAMLEDAVREVGQIQFRQEIGDFEDDDLLAMRECCDKAEKVTFKNEEDSILRFEKELIRIVNQLPIPPNGNGALKWNLYRDW